MHTTNEDNDIRMQVMGFIFSVLSLSVFDASWRIRILVSDTGGISVLKNVIDMVFLTDLPFLHLALEPCEQNLLTT